jgi:hypothetical protein
MASAHAMSKAHTATLRRRPPAGRDDAKDRMIRGVGKLTQDRRDGGHPPVFALVGGKERRPLGDRHFGDRKRRMVLAFEKYVQNPPVKAPCGAASR